MVLATAFPWAPESACMPLVYYIFDVYFLRSKYLKSWKGGIMIGQKRGFIVLCICHMYQGVSWGKSERSEHKWSSGMVLEVCTEWRNLKCFQSYPCFLQGRIILNPHQNVFTNNWFASEGTLRTNVCDISSGKLGSGVACRIKLFFSLLWISELNEGEEISEESAYSHLVTHESFITGKNLFYNLQERCESLRITWVYHHC